jgi:hypothetical protein
MGCSQKNNADTVLEQIVIVDKSVKKSLFLVILRTRPYLFDNQSSKAMANHDKRPVGTFLIVSLKT